MIKHNQDGAASGVAVSLVFAVLLLIGAVAFGVWAFGSRQDYKNNTDIKITAAVTVAKQQEGTLKDAQFAQAEKNPLRSYNGPEAYGSLVLNYPKTWSGYINDSTDTNSASNGALIDGYFYPGVVPSITDQSSVFALRFQILSQSYSQTLTTLANLQRAAVPATTNPYALPKVPNVIGIEVNGTLPSGKTGTMVILPLRSQTLEVWTEGSQFLGDFNNSILPNLSFSP